MTIRKGNNMLFRTLKIVTLCSISSYCLADLPKDRHNLANYANNLNTPPSNTGYRPFQVTYNQQASNNPVRTSGFSTQYLGVRYSGKNSVIQNEATQSAPIKVQAQPQIAYVAPPQAVQQNLPRPTIRPASYVYSQNQYAGNYDQVIPGRVATVSCVTYAARAEGVPLYVLLGIHSKERGNNGQTARNKNSSLDMGQFQINTIHFKKGGMFESYNKHHVNNDGCLNARLAAKLLRDRLSTNTSKDFWTRAAAYHSWTPYYNNIYKNGNGKQPGLISYSNQWKSWLQKQGLNPN